MMATEKVKRCEVWSIDHGRRAVKTERRNLEREAKRLEDGPRMAYIRHYDEEEHMDSLLQIVDHCRFVTLLTKCPLLAIK